MVPSFFAPTLQVISAGLIAVAVELAFVIQQFHRPAGCSFGQNDSQPDKGSGIGKPGDASKPGALIWKRQRYFGPGAKGGWGLSLLVGSRSEIVRHRDGIIHVVPIELD